MKNSMKLLLIGIGFLLLSVAVARADNVILRPQVDYPWSVWAAGGNCNRGGFGDFDCVWEDIADENTTYIQANVTANSTFLTNGTDFTDANSPIDSISIFIRASEGDGGFAFYVLCDIIKLQNGSEFNSGVCAIVVGESYQDYEFVWPSTAGNGSPWSWNEINNMQTGASASGHFASAWAKATQVWVNVTYTNTTYCAGNYSGIGEWIVNSSTNLICHDEAIPLTGNLSVYGNLTFSNITLQVQNTYDGEFNISTYSNSRFNITNQSNITVNDPSFEYAFEVKNGSTLGVFNSVIEEAGWATTGIGRGFVISTTNASIIRNSTFARNLYGTILDSAQNILYVNNTIMDTDNITGVNSGLILITGTNNNLSENYIVRHASSIQLTVSSTRNIVYKNYIEMGNTTGTDSGILLTTSSDNNTIRNNTVTSPITGQNFGIYLTTDNNTIGNNTVFTKAEYGIYLDTGADNNSIGNNTVYNQNLGGIFIVGKNNTIHNNTFRGNAGDGIRLSGGATSGVIEDNWIFNNTDNGIEGNSASNLLIKNNTIYNNSRHGVQWFSGSANGSIIGNRIYNNSNRGIAFSSSTSGDVIINNTIYNNSIGIEFGTTVQHELATGNILYNNSQGLFFGSATNVTLHSMQVYNNTLAALNNTLGLDIKLENVTFDNATIWLNNSNTTFLNVTHNESRIVWAASSTGNISIGWYVRVNVTNNNSVALDGAAVDYTDNFSHLVYNDTLTDATGLTLWKAINTTFQTRTSNTNYNNWTFLAVKDGYLTNSTTRNITNSQTVWVSLVLAPKAFSGERIIVSAARTQTIPSYNFSLFLGMVTMIGIILSGVGLIVGRRRREDEGEEYYYYEDEDDSEEDEEEE